MIQSVLITGANKGLGFEAVKQLSAAFPNAIIFLGTRSVSRGQEALTKLRAENLGEHVQVLELDMSSDDSIKRAFEYVRGSVANLDVLINNAGISSEGNTAADVFGTNLFGVKTMIDTFTPILSQNGLIINVSSEVGTWSQNSMNAELQDLLSKIEDVTWEKLADLTADYQSPTPKHTWPSVDKTFGPYGVSKALLTCYTRRLAADNSNLRVVAVCPGYCRTEINGNTGFRSPTVGAASIIWPIFNPSFEVGLLYQDGVSQPFSAPMAPHIAAYLSGHKE
ncbi:hypothetical protein HK100_012628 [Physocladia obscura]|uniref:NAD(P)-binding protein n=1 Tax=Physocladia obscura TaxID=109957 RepID=A0AAD5T5I4_9FUNG|nr:hypothetical protein HK100_012628 [Physocladia obscura]